MPTAKDVMTDCIISTTKDTPLYKAIDLMLMNRISGLPVVEDDMTLVGIITEKDILTLHNDLELSDSIFVEDIMTKNVIHFEKNDTIENICNCLLHNDFRRVPVTSDGKVVGIISRPDITRRILQIIRRRRNKSESIP